jgi:acetyltransferase-like isoleucine patch superfamily enzyme
MTGKHALHGKWTPAMIGKPLEYFALREAFIDCRGTLKIHPTSEWGWYVTVITRSHDVSGGQYSKETVDRPVTVDEHAWICSRALLYNCHIQHHAIVACGAVVRNMTVEPYTVVEGNPAVPVRRFVDGQWVPIER